MKLLVLGGTRHVGRSVVEVACHLGHSVTTINRGLSGPAAEGVDARRADRTDPAALADALGADQWDAVIDTWSGAPYVVGLAAGLLADRVHHYGYVSSRSVYRWPIPSGADESAPVVEGDPGSRRAGDYAEAKRGGELAVVESFADRGLLARAGLILGPYEYIGRLPWWLRRLERGGRVLAPGPRSRPLQYIDGRDLGAWMISMAEQSQGGAFNAVSAPGHTTMGLLLDCAVDVVAAGAELVWVQPEVIEEFGISAWTELPIWLPPDGEAIGLHDGDVTAALRHGLHCRPIEQTVADTWQWLQVEGDPSSLADGSVGLSLDREAAVLERPDAEPSRPGESLA